MLDVIITEDEHWDEEKEEFIPAFPPVKLTLEHSLLSLSKWESKWHKPYLQGNLSKDETVDYIRCMTITQGVHLEVYDHIDDHVINRVADYIGDPMTATWFTDDKVKNGQAPARGSLRGEVITSELLYYYMFSCGIPKECEKWHLNRLITLIRVFGEKNKPPKKQSTRDLISQYASLNAQRKAKLGTRG